VIANRLVWSGLLAGSLVLGACGSDSSTSSIDTTVAADATVVASAADAPATSAPVTVSPTTAGSGAEASAPGPAGSGRGGGFSAAPAATHANVTYAPTSASQVLDLWLPPKATGSTPLVIYIHGGAFKGGDKAMVGGKVQPLLDAGYAVASLNYRLSGEALFPAGVQDVKAAVRWLRANAATYNLDPNRFAAWGESAGGHLASIIGTTGDQTTPLDDPSLGNSEVSSAVQAVVDWYGPTDFGQMDAQAASGGGCTAPQVHDTADSPESVWLGGALQTVPEVVAQANPITYIATAKKLPAFSIAHGDADCNVPYQQSQILAAALTAAGTQPELTILPGATHGGPGFDDTLRAPTIAWLATVLG
jgi:acetyl esterase/lipase